MRLDTLSGALALLAGGWFAVCAALWGVANTLDAIALALHRLAGAWRALHERKARALSQDWVVTLERGLAPPGASQPQDEALGRAMGISYTGD